MNRWEIGLPVGSAAWLLVLLEQDIGPLVTSAMVMAEAAYLLERDLDVDAELALYTSVIDGALLVET